MRGTTLKGHKTQYKTRLGDIIVVSHGKARKNWQFSKMDMENSKKQKKIRRAGREEGSSGFIKKG